MENEWFNCKYYANAVQIGKELWASTEVGGPNKSIKQQQQLSVEINLASTSILYLNECSVFFFFFAVNLETTISKLLV